MSRDVPPLSVYINWLNDTFSDFCISCIAKTSQATLKTLQVKAESMINISLVDEIFQRMKKAYFIFGIMLSSSFFVACILKSLFPLFFNSRNSLKTHSITVGSSSNFDFAMVIVPPYWYHLSQAYHSHIQNASLPVTIPETRSFNFDRMFVAGSKFNFNSEFDSDTSGDFDCNSPVGFNLNFKAIDFTSFNSDYETVDLDFMTVDFNFDFESIDFKSFHSKFDSDFKSFHSEFNSDTSDDFNFHSPVGFNFNFKSIVFTAFNSDFETVNLDFMSVDFNFNFKSIDFKSFHFNFETIEFKSFTFDF